MAQLRHALRAMVDDELAGTPFGGADCPWIDHYIDRYARMPEQVGFALVARWTGRDPRGMSSSDVIELVVERARVGVRDWRGGDATGVSIDGTMVDPLRMPDGTGAVGAVRAQSLAGLHGGQPLSSSMRTRAEATMGGSFADVQLHTGRQAQELSARAGARAFTVGNHIVLGSAVPAPGTPLGDAVMAHELAHVRQQRETGMGASTDALESNADDLAAATLNGGPVPAVRPAGGLRLQRCSEPDYNMGVTDWPWPRLTQAEIEQRRSDYQLAIALLDARALDLQSQGASASEREQVTEMREALALALRSMDDASPHLHSGEDLAWFESRLGWAGWLPMSLAVRQRSTERDPSWQAGVRTANRYRILRERDGHSPARAIGTLALVTAGEFVGVTQLAEAAAGREAITNRELSTPERILRGAVGVIAVASLASGTGGPRLGGWARGLRVPQVRYMAVAGGGGRVPVLVFAEGAAPIALTQAETAALSQAGLINLAMMSASSGEGAGTPSSQGRGGTSSSSSSPRPADLDPGGRGNYHLDDRTIGRLPASDAARLRELQSRLPRSPEELAQLVDLRQRAAGRPLPATPGTPEHMLARWQQYSSQPNPAWTFQRWAAGHPSRMRNSVAGVAREEAYRSALQDVGVDARARVTRVGNQPRQVDAHIPGAEGVGDDFLQIKGGRNESLTTTARRSGGSSAGSSSLSNEAALAVDAQLVRQGNRVHWVFENPPTGPLARRAVDSGVRVVIRVDNAAERARMIGLMERAGMTRESIARVEFVEGTLDRLLESIVVGFGRAP